MAGADNRAISDAAPRVRPGVLLVGALPPPVGGVSIHLQRFLARLGAGAAVLDLRKRTLYRRDGASRRWRDILRNVLAATIVHIHVSSELKLVLALLARLAGKRVLYTHHNNIIARPRLFGLLFRLCHHVIFVNDRCIPEWLRQSRFASRWSVIPAFIPPDDDSRLPDWLEAQLTGFQAVVATNCYRRGYLDGEEVYGFDLLTQAFHALEAGGRLRDTVFVFLDPSGTYAGVHGLGAGVVTAAGNQMLYIGGQDLSYPALLRRATVSVRPTRTDGDSLSVRESLHYGTPVVASDVVDRPAGTVLFATGKADDLADKLAAALSRGEGDATPSASAVESILQVYSCLEKNR